MPATSTHRCGCLERHQRLPRGTETWREHGVVSWLRAATLTFPADLPVVLRARVVLPDTVAGPHRHFTGFRGSVSRINCERSLPLPERSGKRNRHRTAYGQRETDDECLVHVSPASGRKDDDRRLVGGHVVSEKAPEAAALE